MVFAWQGWQLEMPRHWSPLRLEGSYDEGYAMVADLHRPRFALRWKRAGKRLDAPAWTRKTMGAEIGRLANEEAVEYVSGVSTDWAGGRLYIEPKPPGRDVWVALSKVSERTVEFVYHAHRRDRILCQRLLPTLRDMPLGQSMDWSVFDLSCRSPAGLVLIDQRLNAGDLSLSFGDRKKTQVTVRQVALASLAVKRQPLEKWLTQQIDARRRYYHAVGVVARQDDTGLLSQGSRRRWRWCWRWWIAPSFVTLAAHDLDRDRLVIVDATSRELATQMFQSVAWAGDAAGGGAGDTSEQD